MLHFRTLLKNDFCSLELDLYSERHVRTRKSIFSIFLFFLVMSQRHPIKHDPPINHPPTRSSIKRDEPFWRGLPEWRVAQLKRYVIRNPLSLGALALRAGYRSPLYLPRRQPPYPFAPRRAHFDLESDVGIGYRTRMRQAGMLPRYKRQRYYPALHLHRFAYKPRRR